jgi:hypothetical protein
MLRDFARPMGHRHDPLIPNLSSLWMLKEVERRNAGYRCRDIPNIVVSIRGLVDKEDGSNGTLNH